MNRAQKGGRVYERIFLPRVAQVVDVIGLHAARVKGSNTEEVNVLLGGLQLRDFNCSDYICALGWCIQLIFRSRVGIHIWAEIGVRVNRIVMLGSIEFRGQTRTVGLRYVDVGDIYVTVLI